jgi:RNA polymerase sigma factor (sigma-70 family)
MKKSGYLFIHRDDEASIVEGCRKGDSRAQRLLYERFASVMYALCCRYLKNKADAEDVLVTAFTRIFERFNQYRGEGSLEGWIRRVMVNECLAFLRKSRRLFLQTDLEQAASFMEGYPASDQLEAEDLMRLITELPDGYRTVFNMYVIEGYTHQEIAERLGISENTSKSQLSRAREYLQKRLAAYEKKINAMICHESAN